MTTAQITILGLTFIFDFWLSIVRPIYKSKLEIDGLNIILSMFRMMIIWSIAISVTIGLNQERKKCEGKCPELEPVENVYKIKTK